MCCGQWRIDPGLVLAIPMLATVRKAGAWVSRSPAHGGQFSASTRRCMEPGVSVAGMAMQHGINAKFASVVDYEISGAKCYRRRFASSVTRRELKILVNKCSNGSHPGKEIDLIGHGNENKYPLPCPQVILPAHFGLDIEVH